MVDLKSMFAQQAKEMNKKQAEQTQLEEQKKVSEVKEKILSLEEKKEKFSVTLQEVEDAYTALREAETQKVEAIDAVAGLIFELRKEYHDQFAAIMKGFGVLNEGDTESTHIHPEKLIGKEAFAETEEVVDLASKKTVAVENTQKFIEKRDELYALIQESYPEEASDVVGQGIEFKVAINFAKEKITEMKEKLQELALQTPEGKEELREKVRTNMKKLVEHNFNEKETLHDIYAKLEGIDISTDLLEAEKLLEKDDLFGIVQDTMLEELKKRCTEQNSPNEKTVWKLVKNSIQRKLDTKGIDEQIQHFREKYKYDYYLQDKKKKLQETSEQARKYGDDLYKLQLNLPKGFLSNHISLREVEKMFATDEKYIPDVVEVYDKANQTRDALVQLRDHSAIGKKWLEVFKEKNWADKIANLEKEIATLESSKLKFMKGKQIKEKKTGIEELEKIQTVMEANERAWEEVTKVSDKLKPLWKILDYKDLGKEYVGKAIEGNELFKNLEKKLEEIEKEKLSDEEMKELEKLEELFRKKEQLMRSAKEDDQLYQKL